MMAAPIAVVGAGLKPGAPVVLFPTRIVGGGVEARQGQQYDVAPDGRVPHQHGAARRRGADHADSELAARRAAVASVAGQVLGCCARQRHPRVPGRDLIIVGGCRSIIERCGHPRLQ